MVAVADLAGIGRLGDVDHQVEAAAAQSVGGGWRWMRGRARKRRQENRRKSGRDGMEKREEGAEKGIYRGWDGVVAVMGGIQE